MAKKMGKRKAKEKKKQWKGRLRVCIVTIGMEVELEMEYGCIEYDMWCVVGCARENSKMRQSHLFTSRSGMVAKTRLRQRVK